MRWRDPDAPPVGAVTPVEVFFDIVFVYTLTQLTHTLEVHLSLATVARVLLLFGVLRWMYGGYAWLTNHVPPRRPSQKLLLFTGMAGFLVAAVGIPHVRRLRRHLQDRLSARHRRPPAPLLAVRRRGRGR